MATTKENLAQAFAGESQAHQKYLAFAQKADAEGFKEVARLFRAAARAEEIHAQKHLAHMEGVKTTAENLQAAIAGETYEFTEMYPPMVKQAEDEKSPARTTFAFAAAAEKRHAQLYDQALAAVRGGKDLATAGVYLCPVCGNILPAKPTAPCEICGAAPDKFTLVD